MNVKKGDEAPVPEAGIKPTFTRHHEVLPSNYSKTITLESQCAADPAPTVTWYHGETEITDGERYKTSLSQYQKLYMLRLEINNVEYSDKGEYRVIAKNSYGEEFSNFNINLDSYDDVGERELLASKPPSFLKLKILRYIGSSLMIKCELEANPIPEFNWFYESFLVPPSFVSMKSHDVSNDSFNVSLVIPSPKQENAGIYTCKVINRFGELNVSIYLGFDGRTLQLRGKKVVHEETLFVRFEQESRRESLLPAEPCVIGRSEQEPGPSSNSGKEPVPARNKCQFALPAVPDSQPGPSSLKDTPPQPTLKMSALTQGIQLTWDIPATSEHEEIASYKLYNLMEWEGTTGEQFEIEEITEFNAGPTPMTLNLTGLTLGHAYYFAVEAVDIYDRVGDLSPIVFFRL